MDNSIKPNKGNPRKNANFLDVLLITWIWPLMYKGSKKGLTDDDLTKTLEIDESEQLGDELEKIWTKEREKCKRNGNKPSLRNAIFKTYYKPFTYNGVIMYVFVLCKTVLPMILAQLLKHYQMVVAFPENINNMNNTINGTNEGLTETSSYSYQNVINYFHYIWNDKIWLTSLTVLVPFIAEITFHHYELRQKLLGSRMRVACCSVVYRKTLKLSKKVSDETSVGYVMNLLSNDVSRLDVAFLFAHYLWITPVQTCLICYILYDVVGFAGIIGVFCLIIQLIPVQTFLTKMVAKLRLKVAERTDQRVGIMNEILKGILVVKMYAWEKPFQTVVAEVRRLEIKQVRYASFIKGACNSSFAICERSTLFFTIVAMLYFDVPISADVVFSLALYFSLLQLITALGFTFSLQMLTEGLVSIKRIENFLNLEELDPALHGLVTKKDSLIQLNQPILEIKTIVASWTDSKLKTLDGVNFNALPGKLCAIIGPVGSGKSSLLQAVLGELPIQFGNIVVKGSLSYGSQEPWLFSGTMQNNILFGQSFDKTRYDEVIKCCALTSDLKQLPYGDKTFVGERGVTLSGGQKSRTSLARAVYKKAEIYLLDDPLSAVDTHVGKHLYNKVIGPEGFLAKTGATRVLVTHQTHFLQEADWIVVIKDGKILQQGTYKHHANSGLDFTKLLEHENEEKHKQTDENLDPDEESEEVPLLKAENDTEMISRNDSVATIDTIGKSVQSLYETQQPVAEHKAQGTVSLKVWTRYFLGGGSLGYLLYTALLFLLSQIICNVCDYFLSIWTQQEFLRANNLPTTYTRNECLYIFAALIVGVFIFILLRCYTFFNICMRASKTLHNNMFGAILHAPMKFFDTNPSGQILNRFSRDMGNVDEVFPRSLWGTVQVMFFVCGMFALVIVVNPKLIIALGGVIIVYVFLIRVYLRAAQDLKRLEGTTRSPVFGHVAATLNGLTTIRVNAVQQKVSKEFDELQNVHTNVWQLSHACNSGFALWLDIISCIFVGFVAFSFILFKDDTFAGNVGLAISQSLMLTGLLQFGIRQTTESIQIMTCVERILEYSDVKPEYSPETTPSETWPEKGKIEFNELSYSYDKNLPPVLNQIKIEIKSGWKVGVVGRTGAGKSSLIGALFRIAHIDGQIKIDDIDTGKISLDSLRKNITIIPQDPVLFSATIRYNLDPFGLYADEQLWNVLDEVELKSKIKSLDYQVTESGTNFSVGERQLICLGRAILRNNKIFVLDEATANVDPQTDALIQKTIRSKFVDRTVITIAHRLHTVMDCDRILVMEAGIVREFDIPHILLQNQNGYLSRMVAAMGGNESEALKKFATLAYTKCEQKKELL